jgi:hypothetical protein
VSIWNGHDQFLPWNLKVTGLEYGTGKSFPLHLYDMPMSSRGAIKDRKKRKNLNKELEILAQIGKNLTPMGKGRKQKTQKMKNRKSQAKLKARIKKKAEAVKKSRA